MTTKSHGVVGIRWYSLLAVAGLGFSVGACGNHHRDEGHDRNVVVQDEVGNRHEGYYDEQHAWHGGYYDTGKQFHEDPRDWRHDAVVVEHPELRRNDAADHAEHRDDHHDDHPDEHR